LIRKKGGGGGGRKKNPPPPPLAEREEEETREERHSSFYPPSWGKGEGGTEKKRGETTFSSVLANPLRKGKRKEGRERRETPKGGRKGGGHLP